MIWLGVSIALVGALGYALGAALQQFEAVSEGGWAALGQLGDGDVLLEIDGEAVPDVEAVKQKMERIAEKRPSTVVLKVRRGIRTLFVELQSAWPAGQAASGRPRVP